MRTKLDAKNEELRMKNNSRQSFRWLMLVCFFILNTVICPRALAQPYSIDWYKVSGSAAPAPTANTPSPARSASRMPAAR